MGRGEKDDPGRPGQLQRPGQELPDGDGRPRIAQLVAGHPNGRETQQRADHVQRRRGDQRRPRRLPDPVRRAVEPLDDVRADEEQEPAERHRAEAEGEGAERDEEPHLAHGEALGRVGPVADHRARQDRGPDVVGDGVGDERRQRDERPADPAAEVQERDPVVPGERRVGERGRGAGQRPPHGRDRPERLAEARERQTAQFPQQKPRRHGHRAEADDRPCDVLNPLHARLVRESWGKGGPRVASCPSKAANARPGGRACAVAPPAAGHAPPSFGFSLIVRRGAPGLRGQVPDWQCATFGFPWIPLSQICLSKGCARPGREKSFAPRPSEAPGAQRRARSCGPQDIL